MPVRVDGDESESNKYVQLKLKNEALESRGTLSPYCETGYDKSPGLHNADVTHRFSYDGDAKARASDFDTKIKINSRRQRDN